MGQTGVELCCTCVVGGIFKLWSKDYFVLKCDWSDINACDMFCMNENACRIKVTFWSINNE